MSEDIKGAEAQEDTRGFESLSEAVKVINKLKADLDTHKVRKTELEETKTRLATFEAEAEKARLARLSETERLQEELRKREEVVIKMQAEVDSIRKARVFDEVVYDALKDKPLNKVRKSLYEARATQWGTKEDLLKIIEAVDAELDSELQGIHKAPLPGDGAGVASSSQLDDSYFDKLNRKLQGGGRAINRN